MLRFDPRRARAAQTPLQVLLYAFAACNHAPSEPGSVPEPAALVCMERLATSVGTSSWTARGPLAEAVGHWLRQGEPQGQVAVPNCEPRVACGPLLSLYCEWPVAPGAAPNVRVASFWGCAELPTLKLTVSSLCDENASCVTRVVEVLHEQAGLQRWPVTGEVALRVNGLEFVSDDALADGGPATPRTVVVEFETLRRAFQSARAFAFVKRHLEERCIE